MPKTIVLANYNPKLAQELQAHGFRVIDQFTREASGQVADAVLYASYRPDTDSYLTNHSGHADISIGNYHYITTDHPATIMFNITGLNSDQIIDTLHHKLARQQHL